MRHEIRIEEMVMKQSCEDKYANYCIDYRNKEYVFSIDRRGRGKCQCHSDAYDAAQREDQHMMIKLYIFRDKKARNRWKHLEEEFTLDVKLPEEVTQLIWEGQDELDDGPDPGRLTIAVRNRERKIDRLLRPVIKNYFL